MTRQQLEDNLAEVRGRIRQAADAAGRDPNDVTLVAVTKTFPIEILQLALDAGLLHLGENRAQELKEKASVLGRTPRWHFIGNLQTNKVRNVVGVAELVHSVDRFGLAEAIDRRAAALGIVQDVLLEVNVSLESSKHGVEPSGALNLAHEIGRLGSVKLKGLMTMAPLSDDPESSRAYFAELRELSERLRSDFPDATLLSMGMTYDYPVAVKEGSTHVRVGRALFGSRSR